MEIDWRQRLIMAIEKDGRSPRAISLEAKLGANYLSQMIERGTSPSTPAFVALCNVLGLSVTYVFTGAEMTPEDEELLRLSSDLRDEQKDLLRQVARQLKASEPH